MWWEVLAPPPSDEAEEEKGEGQGKEGQGEGEAEEEEEEEETPPTADEIRMLTSESFELLSVGLSLKPDGSKGSNGSDDAAEVEVDVELYSQLLGALELHGWALEAPNLPSTLGNYCFDSLDVDPTRQAAVLMAIGPTLKFVADAEAASREEDEDQGEDEQGVEGSGAGGGAGSGGGKRKKGEAAPPLPPPSQTFGVCECDGEHLLPTPTSAQKTSAVRLPKFMSKEEIAAIHEVSRVMEEEENLKVVFKGGATDGDPNWRTHYMQAEHGFQRHVPHLVTKIIEAMKQVDSENWRVLEGRDPSKLKVRVVELHTVRPNGSLPDPTHFDRGSLITLDVMLSPPNAFTGGQFSTLNADLSYTDQVSCAHPTPTQPYPNPTQPNPTVSYRTLP